MRTLEDYQQGMAAYMARRYEQAALLLEQAAHRAARPVALIARYYLGKAHHQLGRELLAQGLYSPAARHFSAASRMIADNNQLCVYLAACHAGSERFDAACDELERALARQPLAAEIRIRLALAQCKAGQPLRGVSTLMAGIQRQPNEAELHYHLGVVLAGIGQLTEAEHRFETALAFEPDHVRALERVAQCCGVQGRGERARRYLEQACRLEPENSRIAWQLTIIAPADTARILAGAGRSASRLARPGLRRLAGIVLDEPEFIDAFAALPPSAADEEIFVTLAAALQAALDQHSRYADLHYRYGTVARRLGWTSEAIDAAERAVQINPRYVNALVLLAELFAQSDQTTNAVARLEAAVQAGGDYPDLHLLLGRLCQRMGRTERARLAYQRALALNANYEEARAALAGLAA